jgi:hypothetical protein
MVKQHLSPNTIAISLLIPEALESNNNKKFPVQRISWKRGFYEYVCTFLVTTIILGGLMVAGPVGVESLFIKLFQT